MGTFLNYIHHKNQWSKTCRFQYRHVVNPGKKISFAKYRHAVNSKASGFTTCRYSRVIEVETGSYPSFFGRLYSLKTRSIHQICTKIPEFELWTMTAGRIFEKIVLFLFQGIWVSSISDLYYELEYYWQTFTVVQNVMK